MKTNTAKRIKDLHVEIDRHNQLYYQQAEPEISDAEYDALMGELKTLEAAHPELLSEQSPSQRVGGAPLDEFEQREHLIPMLSIEDVHELKDEELEKLRLEKPDATRAQNLLLWYERLTRTLGRSDFLLTVEPKIDGVAVSLVYKDGLLDYALTRGDGSFGDDVTQNIDRKSVV